MPQSEDSRAQRRREAAAQHQRDRQRNMWIMLGVVAVVIIAFAWVLMGPSDSPSPAPATTPTVGTSGTTGTTGTTDTTGTTGITGTTDTTGTTGLVGTETTGTTDTAGTTSTTGDNGAGLSRSIAGVDVHARDRHLVVAAKPARAQVRVPVLMYHRVASEATVTNATSYGLTVTPATFRQQISWLKGHGYTAVSQAEVFNAMEHGTRLPAKPVVLTFDDGYVDATDAVLPVLEPLKWPATFFIITGRIGERAFLTWNQLKRLDSAGMDIGSHTVAHTELPSLSSSQRTEALRASRSTLEKGLGHPVRWFCYPAGRHDPTSANAVDAAGYLLAYTTDAGSTLRSDQRAVLPRVRVSGGQSLSSFAASMTAASA